MHDCFLNYTIHPQARKGLRLNLRAEPAPRCNFHNARSALFVKSRERCSIRLYKPPALGALQLQSSTPAITLTAFSARSRTSNFCGSRLATLGKPPAELASCTELTMMGPQRAAGVGWDTCCCDEACGWRISRWSLGVSRQLKNPARGNQRKMMT